MSLVGWSCSGRSRRWGDVAASLANDWSAEMEKAVTEFDTEEKARRDQQVIKDNDALRKREQSFLAQDRPLFAISKACLDLVARFVMVAAIAAATAAVQDERVVEFAGNRFPRLIGSLGWLGIDSAKDLMEGVALLLTILALSCALGIAFLFFREIAVFFRSRLLQVVLWVIVAFVIFFSVTMLVGFVFRLSV